VITSFWYWYLLLIFVMAVLQNEKRIGWTNVGELENCVHFTIGKTSDCCMFLSKAHNTAKYVTLFV